MTPTPHLASAPRAGARTGAALIKEDPRAKVGYTATGASGCRVPYGSDPSAPRRVRGQHQTAILHVSPVAEVLKSGSKAVID